MFLALIVKVKHVNLGRPLKFLDKHLSKINFHKHALIRKNKTILFVNIFVLLFYNLMLYVRCTYANTSLLQKAYCLPLTIFNRIVMKIFPSFNFFPTFVRNL